MFFQYCAAIEKIQETIRPEHEMELEEMRAEEQHQKDHEAWLQRDLELCEKFRQRRIDT